MTIAIWSQAIKGLQLGGNSITSAYLGDKKVRPTGITGDIMHYRRDGNYNNSASDQYHLHKDFMNSNHIAELSTTPQWGKYVRLYNCRLKSNIVWSTQDIGTITFWQKNDMYSSNRIIWSDSERISINIDRRPHISVVAWNRLDEYDYIHWGTIPNSSSRYKWHCITLLFRYEYRNWNQMIHSTLYRNWEDICWMYWRRERYGTIGNINFMNFMHIGWYYTDNIYVWELIVDSNRWDNGKIQEYYNSTKHLYTN